MDNNTAPASQENYWLRSGFFSLMEKVAGMAFNLFTAMLLFRMWADESDKLAAWSTFILLAYFVEMGRSGLLQNGLVRALATRKNDPIEQSQIVSAALALNLFFSLFSNLLLFSSADFIGEYLQVPMLVEALPFYFVTNILMAFGAHCYFVQQAHFEFRGVFWLMFFYRGVPFLWVAWCWLTGNPVLLWQFSAAMTVGTMLASLASWWYARPFLFFSPKLNYSWLKDLAGYGRFVLGTNLSTMLYKNIDKLMLGQLLGPAAFVAYDAAGRVTQLVEAPAFSIAAVVFPKSAEKMALQGKTGVRDLYEKSVGATLAVILPFVILVLVFAEPIIWIFAGKTYLESAGLLRLTAFFGLFMPFAVQFGTVLDSSGQAAKNLAYTFFTAALNLGLTYWMVAKFGLYGAAYAMLLGYSISFALMQRFLREHFGTHPLRAFAHVPGFYKIGWQLIKQRLRS